MTMIDKGTDEQAITLTSEWTAWSDLRPEKIGHYWWRLPTAIYGGLEVRPEWVCEVCTHGMGYGDSELWPRMSHWDGFRRTVPAGLEWSGDGSAKDCPPRIPGLRLDDCPFCSGEPTLTATDYPIGGGFRLYTSPFRPNQFKITCRCGVANSNPTADLKGLVERWNCRPTPSSPTDEMRVDDSRINDFFERLGLGTGEDPVGFLLASHAHMAHERNEGRAEIARLKALTWMAWREFNAIRARSGSPLDQYGLSLVDHDYWDRMTKALKTAADHSAPWPTDEMRPILSALIDAEMEKGR